MIGRDCIDQRTGRYTPSRIYTTSLDLATPEKPLLIPSSDPLRSHSRTIGLAVGFDLRLPGWLPSSRVSTHVTTEHGMIVRSSAGWTEAATLAYDPPHIGHRMIQTRTIRRSVSLLAQLSSTTESHTSPYTPITIRRHRLPSAMSDRHSDHTERHYSLKPANDSTSPIECIVSVPDWVDCNGGEKDLKVSIRVRARREAVQAAVHASKPTSPVPVVAPTTPEASDDIETDNSAGVPQNLDHSEPLSVPMERDTSAEILTHILELGMEVDEVETYTSQPSPNFLSLFPIPADQPARSSTENDFISPRNERAAVPPSAAGNLDDKLFTSARRRKCLLADDGSQRNFVFDNDGLAMSERWRKVNIVLPMPQGGKKGSATCRPRSEYDSPMLRVKHALNIRVVCKNVGNPAEDIVSAVTFIAGWLGLSLDRLTSIRLLFSPLLSDSGPTPRRCLEPSLRDPTYQRTSSCSMRTAISENATLSHSTPPRDPAALHHHTSHPSPRCCRHYRSPTNPYRHTSVHPDRSHPNSPPARDRQSTSPWTSILHCQTTDTAKQPLHPHHHHVVSCPSPSHPGRRRASSLASRPNSGLIQPSPLPHNVHASRSTTYYSRDTTRHRDFATS